MVDDPTPIQETLTLPQALERAACFRDEGRLADAEQLSLQILGADPDHFDALHLLGLIKAQQGYNETGMDYLSAALRINPNSAQVHLNRGNMLSNLGRREKAIVSFDTALAIKPDYAEALNNRGDALLSLCRPDEALASYNAALAIKPDYPQMLSNRGRALRNLGRLEEALASFDKAVAIKPDYAQGFFFRGNLLGRLNRYEEAVASYETATAIKPDYVGAHKILGNLLHDQGKIDNAMACYERALAIKPDYADAKIALCIAQLPILYVDEPEIATRRTAYAEHLRALRSDIDRRRTPGDLADGIGSTQPFYLAYQGGNDRELQALYGDMVCRIAADRYPQAALAPPPGPGEPVRVGFVSGFFSQHSNWKIPIKGWLSQLDRRRFQIFGYHTGINEDTETKAAIGFCDRFVQGPLSVDRWRQTILADALHVLIYPEVGMDGVAVQLAAQRLAPVQCNSWGHPDTSGFPTLDYYLSSELMEPPEGQDHYTERLIRLPNLSIYYEPLDLQPVSLSRGELGLRPTATVYWCGQSIFKYLPQFDQVFPRIAREAGDCQFTFIEYHRGTYLNDLLRQRLDRAFAVFGLKAVDYCVFMPRLDSDRFAGAVGQSDIVLDSIGWSGCNSTLESLQHNLPIVTIAGPLMRGRHTMAILKMMGVEETITETIDDYVSTAVRLARDLRWRMAIRHKISQNKHRLYRDTACVSALDEFLNCAVRRGTGEEQNVG